MRRISWIFLLMMLFFHGFQHQALALSVFFEGLPDNYNVFQWDGEKNNVKAKPTYKSRQFRRIKFDIPDEFVERSADGSINLTKSLENWRIGTKVGFQLPKTYASGLARFPFTVDNGTLDRRATQNVYYIAAQQLLQNVDKLSRLRFGTSNEDDKLFVENLGLIERVKNIAKGSIDCKGGRSAVASWTPEKCLMCNCANEAYANDVTGQTMISQVVFRRVVSEYFPQKENRSSTRNNICGIISEPSQFSWVGKPNQKTIKPDSEYMNNCEQTTIDAINKGPGNYDHFHVTNITPAWADRSKRLDNSVGNHYFYRILPTNNAERADLDRELNSSGGKQIFRPLENADTEYVELEDEGAL